VSISSTPLYREFLATLDAVELDPQCGNPTAVIDADLADLPDTVQRYLRFMGADGCP
jgi:hypothetical protein